MPSCTILVSTRDCVPDTLTPADVASKYVIINNPNRADDYPEPTLKPSTILRKVFASMTLGALSGQYGASDGCRTTIDYSINNSDVQIVLFCAQNQVSKYRRPDAAAAIKLAHNIGLPTKHGIEPFRDLLRKVLTWIDNNVNVDKLPNAMVKVNKTQAHWKLHTRRWVSGLEATLEVLTSECSQDGEAVRQARPQLTAHGITRIVNAAVARLAEQGVWDDPAIFVNEGTAPASAVFTSPDHPAVVSPAMVLPETNAYSRSGLTPPATPLLVPAGPRLMQASSHPQPAATGIVPPRVPLACAVQTASTSHRPINPLASPLISRAVPSYATNQANESFMAKLHEISSSCRAKHNESRSHYNQNLNRIRQARSELHEVALVADQSRATSEANLGRIRGVEKDVVQLRTDVNDVNTKFQKHIDHTATKFSDLSRESGKQNGRVAEVEKAVRTIIEHTLDQHNETSHVNDLSRVNTMIKQMCERLFQLDGQEETRV